jgi:hypothetical protein
VTGGGAEDGITFQDTKTYENPKGISSKKGGCHGITVPFCGKRPQFWGFQPHKYMKFEAGMRFAALISFFRR